MDHKLDEKDRQILRQLQRDASLSVDQLADAVAMSRNACWRRVKQLEAAGVIDRRVAVIRPGAVGLNLQVLVFVRTNDHSSAWLDAFRRAVREMPEITVAQRMTGDIDYLLRVYVADMEAYDAFYRRLIDKVPIADVSASFLMEDLKDTQELPI